MNKINKYLDNIFTNIDPNIKLDYLQKQAVLCEKQNQLIIAGAGSGKTTVIAAKIKYLVEIKKIPAGNILVISFTNKAINELKERINKELNIGCTICTFHKFGLEIIKDYDEKTYQICTNTIDVIRKIMYQINNKNINKLFCEYYSIKGLKKVLYSSNPFKKTINKEKYDQFISFCNDLVIKYKTYEIPDNDNNVNKVIKYLYIKYNEYLNKTNKIDFVDMIVKATNIIDTINEFNYKYIIIDEYQDISTDRFLLIKKISDKFENSIIAVGDDWQSIYSFSGSKIDLFTDFVNIFKDTKVLKINNTYRNSQELINIAGEFIMKNEKQIKKKLLSSKSLKNPIEIIIYRQNTKIKELKNVIEKIINDYPNKNILILGRYKFDINEYIDNYNFKKNNEKIIYRNNKVDITYMTIHASKGLGYDNVILINCKKGVFGFPSQKQDHSILKKLVPKEDNFQLQEERRLFYVALTRTKNKVYLLVPASKKSDFIKEIMNSNLFKNKK